MIKTIELQNFKNHLDTKFTLDDSNLHAFVGPNSSGKTTVLQALYYLSQLTTHTFKEVFTGEIVPEHFTTFQKKDAKVTAGGILKEPAERTTFWSASFFWKLNNRDVWNPTASWEINGEPNSMNGWGAKLSFGLDTILNHSAYLKLSAEKLSQAAYSEEISPKFGYDGTGLAPFLDSLKYEASEKFDDLQRHLKQIVPSVQHIAIRRAKVPVVQRISFGVEDQVLPYEGTKEMTGQEVIFNMSSGKRIPAHAMSEGTIIALGLLAAIMSPNRPNLLLLDDIEQGLHPKAQIELIQVLKKIIETNPGLQIIFTTHSPYIIDELEPSQVHVLNTTPEGYAVVKRLDEHPDLQRGLEVLTTGEFWDAEGEDWILAGETSG